MILPGQTIGILGGGQLGRMMILEGRKMGYRFLTLDPASDCPASQVADQHICGEYHDLTAAQQLAEKADLILYEFENIDPKLVAQLETTTDVPQGSRLLTITRHRLKEKETLANHGIPVTPFRAVLQKSDLVDGLAALGTPAVLKTTTGGYDGKGQWLIKEKEDIQQLPDSLFSSSITYLLEQFVPFERELSVVVARGRTGDVKAFPPTINLHRKHILHLSAVAADRNVSQKAQQLAVRVAETLDVVGLLAVEMFMLPDGTLLVNETAPRPHNSGHYTFDACSTSQFEQMLRACLGLPLREVELLAPAVVMVNLLGEHQTAFFKQLKTLPLNAYAHWYGKTEAKVGRKMGHITFLGDSIQALIDQIEQLAIWSPFTTSERKAMDILQGSANERKSMKT